MGSPLPSPTPSRSNSREPLYRTTSLETRSRSPSPHPTPTPTPQHEYYGSACLTDRSRSPSPTSGVTRSKRAGRKLPATPQKPSSLNLLQKPRTAENMPHVIPSPTVPQPHKSPGSINFPKLNASPTHGPRMNIQPPPLGRKSGQHPQQMAMSPMRPHQYSPSDKNDLNMPSQHGGQAASASHEMLDRDAERGQARHHGGIPPPVLNNARPDNRYTDRERDNRFIENRLDAPPVDAMGRPVMGRPAPQSTNLPNGFKSRDRTPEIGGAGGAPMQRRGRPRPGEQSDSDDDMDWC
jgi:hypothetical protein